MRFYQDEDSGVSIPMAPMIDVVFQLLIFFMVATRYVQTETELRVTLPSQQAGQPPPVIVQVHIEADGNIVVNDVPYDDPTSRELPQLRSRFQLLLDHDRNLPVVIIPDPETPHQRLVDVLNACQATGVKNISFAGDSKMQRGDR
jgi:biopolymer transport protein ExbD